MGIVFDDTEREAPIVKSRLDEAPRYRVAWGRTSDRDLGLECEKGCTVGAVGLRESNPSNERSENAIDDLRDRE